MSEEFPLSGGATADRVVRLEGCGDGAEIPPHYYYLVDRKGDVRDSAASRRPGAEESLAGGRDARQLGVLHVWRLPVLHEVLERGQYPSPIRFDW